MQVLSKLKKYKEKRARLITMTAVSKNNNIFLIYHLDVKGKIINLKLKLKGKKARSISNIFKNADVYEREAHELFGIDFGKKMKSLFLENMKCVM